eukprot:m.224892 g.224892  ORF g.224892 m.224892 type:complete len:244 (+) comp11168_c0_seq1:37-768(+)
MATMRLALSLVVMAICAQTTLSSWVFTSKVAVGKEDPLPTLVHTYVLRNVNGTACAIFATNEIVFDDIPLGPAENVSGTCGQGLTLHFAKTVKVNITLVFGITPLGKGTNLSSLVAVASEKNTTTTYSINVADSARPMDAARDKCFDCDQLIKYELTPGPIAIAFHSVRFQAYLPHKQASANQFSVRDAATTCSGTDEGVDAALICGIIIGVLAGIGVLALLRQVYVTSCRRDVAYQRIGIND